MYGSYYNFKYNSEFGKFLHLLSHLILSHCHMILTLLEGGKKIYLPKFTTSKFYELCFLLSDAVFLVVPYRTAGNIMH